MTIDTGATVWVVMGIVPYEVQDPLRVFQSRDEAETYRSSLELRHEQYVTAKFEYYERVSELAQEAMSEEELQEAVGDAPEGSKEIEYDEYEVWEVPFGPGEISIAPHKEDDDAGSTWCASRSVTEGVPHD